MHAPRLPLHRDPPVYFFFFIDFNFPGIFTSWTMSSASASGKGTSPKRGRAEGSIDGSVDDDYYQC